MFRSLHVAADLPKSVNIRPADRGPHLKQDSPEGWFAYLRRFGRRPTKIDKHLAKASEDHTPSFLPGSLLEDEVFRRKTEFAFTFIPSDVTTDFYPAGLTSERPKGQALKRENTLTWVGVRPQLESGRPSTPWSGSHTKQKS